MCIRDRYQAVKHVSKEMLVFYNSNIVFNPPLLRQAEHIGGNFSLALKRGHDRYIKQDENDQTIDQK